MIACRVVSFDLDQTLCDHDAAVTAGFTAARKVMASNPGGTPAVFIPDLHQRFRAAGEILKRRADAQEVPWWPVAEQLSMTFGEPAGSPLVEAAADAFERARQVTVELFPDVPGTLATLRRAGFRLAVLTNGEAATQRAKMARAGLLAMIETVVVSSEIGVHKPDARAYRALCEAVGADPPQVVHVGDDLLHDVKGALAAGLQTIWLQRGPQADQALPESVFVVRRLDAVPELLGIPVPD